MLTKSSVLIMSVGDAKEILARHYVANLPPREEMVNLITEGKLLVPVIADMTGSQLRDAMVVKGIGKELARAHCVDLVWIDDAVADVYEFIHWPEKPDDEKCEKGTILGEDPASHLQVFYKMQVGHDIGIIYRDGNPRLYLDVGFTWTTEDRCSYTEVGAKHHWDAYLLHLDEKDDRIDPDSGSHVYFDEDGDWVRIKRVVDDREEFLSLDLTWGPHHDHNWQFTKARAKRLWKEYENKMLGQERPPSGCLGVDPMTNLQVFYGNGTIYRPSMPAPERFYLTVDFKWSLKPTHFCEESIKKHWDMYLASLLS